MGRVSETFEPSGARKRTESLTTARYFPSGDHCGGSDGVVGSAIVFAVHDPRAYNNKLAGAFPEFGVATRVWPSGDHATPWKFPVPIMCAWGEPPTCITLSVPGDVSVDASATASQTSAGPLSTGP